MITAENHTAVFTPVFRKIYLSDREQMESIRLKYPSELSDYTFPMLFCWQNTLGLQVHLEDELFVIQGKDCCFCPMGESGKVLHFLEKLRDTWGTVTLRFCDQNARDRICSHFGSACSWVFSPDDSDHIVPVQNLKEFAGGKLHKRRGEYHHYRDQDPAPEISVLSSENLSQLRALSGPAEQLDFSAAQLAIQHFEDLKLQGVLIKREGRPVAYMLTSHQYDGVRQGHFCRCLDRDKGAMLFLVRASALYGTQGEEWINLEDDMGVPGLRLFKQSLHGELIPSYTLRIG